METRSQHVIYTIGHSTQTIDEFIGMLQSYNIRAVVDIRQFPGSKKFPYFNKENLTEILPQYGMQYTHLVGLGGRRRVQKNSKNILWRNASFRAYADYMETTEFETAVSQLQTFAMKQITAYMCSEALWWRCHRSMVSDYLKVKGWKVLHIMAVGKCTEHSYTSPARVVGSSVVYYDKDLFQQE